MLAGYFILPHPVGECMTEIDNLSWYLNDIEAELTELCICSEWFAAKD